MLETSASGRATDVPKAAEHEGESKQKRGCALTQHITEDAGPGSRQRGEAYNRRRFGETESNNIMSREEKSRVAESRAESSTLL